MCYTLVSAVDAAVAVFVHGMQVSQKDVVVGIRAPSQDLNAVPLKPQCPAYHKLVFCILFYNIYVLAWLILQFTYWPDSNYRIISQREPLSIVLPIWIKRRKKKLWSHLSLLQISMPKVSCTNWLKSRIYSNCSPFHFIIKLWRITKLALLFVEAKGGISEKNHLHIISYPLKESTSALPKLYLPILPKGVADVLLMIAAWQG